MMTKTNVQKFYNNNKKYIENKSDLIMHATQNREHVHMFGLFSTNGIYIGNGDG